MLARWLAPAAAITAAAAAAAALASRQQHPPPAPAVSGTLPPAAPAPTPAHSQAPSGAPPPAPRNLSAAPTGPWLEGTGGFRTRIRPLGHCARELENFCVGAPGILTYGLDQAFASTLTSRRKGRGVRQFRVRVFKAALAPPELGDWGKLLLPLCGEFGYCDSHAPLASPHRNHPPAATPPAPVNSSARAFLYAVSDALFWTNIFHVFSAALAAFETASRHGLLGESDVFVIADGYTPSGRGWPGRPQGVLRAQGWDFAAVAAALGRSTHAVPGDFAAGGVRCYARGVLGARLWAEGLRGVAQGYNWWVPQYAQLGLSAVVLDFRRRLARSTGSQFPGPQARGCPPGPRRGLLIDRGRVAHDGVGTRRGGRRMSNAGAVLRALAAGGINASAAVFEGTPLRYQLDSVAAADVVVAAWGSGQVWLLFMRTGSPVLTVVPRGHNEFTIHAHGLIGPYHLPGPATFTTVGMRNGVSSPRMALHNPYGGLAAHLVWYASPSAKVEGAPAACENVGSAEGWELKSCEVAADEELLGEFLRRAEGDLRRRDEGGCRWDFDGTPAGPPERLAPAVARAIATGSFPG